MQDAASDQIVANVEAGRDVRIEGEAASAALGTLAARLEGEFNVVRLTAPRGGLGLSALIAQLSGRERFDEQDDGALELGFRRLCGADAPQQRTVLLLDAMAGVQRPVLRYLQQAGHAAPLLNFVIASAPELSTLLEAPDMGRLRARLETVVAAGQLVPVTTGRALTLVTPARLPMAVAVRPQTALRTRRRSRRVALMWATSALVASAAVAAWLGHERIVDRGGILAQAKVSGPPARAWAPVPASVGVPALAAKVMPVQVAGAPTAVADAARPAMPSPVPAPTLAKPTAPETAANLPAPPAEAAGEPAPAVAAKPETVSFAEVEERLSAARVRAAEARRSTAPIRARLAARPKPPGAASRYAEDDRPLPNYDVQDLPPEEPEPVLRRMRGRTATREPAAGEYATFDREAAPRYGSPEPGAARYEPPADSGYIGTYVTGPYGARVFRYDP